MEIHRYRGYCRSHPQFPVPSPAPLPVPGFVAKTTPRWSSFRAILPLVRTDSRSYSARLLYRRIDGTIAAGFGKCYQAGGIG